MLEVKQDATLPPTELVTQLTAIGTLLLPVHDLQHLACSMLHEGTNHCFIVLQPLQQLFWSVSADLLLGRQP